MERVQGLTDGSDKVMMLSPEQVAVIKSLREQLQNQGLESVDKMEAGVKREWKIFPDSHENNQVMMNVQIVVMEEKP